MNKDNTISDADYKQFVPKRRQKSQLEPLRGVRQSKESTTLGHEGVSAATNFVAAMTDRGVIVNKPDHLSAFTIDKDKIDFYKQA